MTTVNCLRAPAILSALTALLLTLPAAIPSAFAAQGGYTNYVPGLYGSFAVAVAPDPGFYMLNDVYYYAADGSNTRVIQGAQVQGDIDLEVGAYILTGLWVTDKELFGGRYALGADLPLIYTDLSGRFDFEGEAVPFDDDGVAVGDLGVVPVALFWNFGNFHINAYESIIVPVGQYDPDELVNGGLGYWSFDTVVAATYLHPEKGFEVSAALGYIFNTENQDIDYRTGQELHVDWMINQYLSETFALGLQGFYYRQTTVDSGTAVVVDDFKGEAAGIGPAVMWATQIKEVGLFVNLKWLYEFHAKNRLEGSHFFINATLAF